MATQGGALRIISNGALLATPALSLGAAVCSNGERGLLGVAVDPAFAANHYVYLYYTFNKNNAGCPTSSQTSPVERVSRFTLPDTNMIDPATEMVLLDNVLSFAGNHNGGDVRFGTDGYLYASNRRRRLRLRRRQRLRGRERRLARPKHPEREDRPHRHGRVGPADEPVDLSGDVRVGLSQRVLFRVPALRQRAHGERRGQGRVRGDRPRAGGRRLERLGVLDDFVMCPLPSRR